MVNYIGGEFQIHGLQLKTEGEMVAFVTAIRDAIRKIHLTLRVESDVEFEVTEQAGEFE